MEDGAVCPSTGAGITSAMPRGIVTKAAIATTKRFMLRLRAMSHRDRDIRMSRSGVPKARSAGEGEQPARFVQGGEPTVPTLVAVIAQVSVDPNAAGMPGAGLMQQLLDWLSQIALWGSLASVLVGAAVYGLSQNTGNYNGAYRGKQLAAAGGIGAILAGLAPTGINLLFRAAGA